MKWNSFIQFLGSNNVIVVKPGYTYDAIVY